ncbi:MAG: 5'-nucleotidase C-terminal domain-containing protein [Phycisphaeraceae bacterium]|nr:5'-nucleotidase C-terminal domain-containing protein [Phycisphaeraceae bacterium]
MMTRALTASMLLGLAAATASAQSEFYLHLLHHNDGESQLISAGSGTLADFGGIARFATVVENLRAEARTFPAGDFARGSMLITSGDNYLPGPEFTVSLRRGVPFFDSVGLDIIGYDAFVIGNHEFDFGPDVMADFINGFTMNPAPFLSANLDFSAEPGLQALVDSGRIAPSTVVEVATDSGVRRVGVIGATTTVLPFISSPRGVVVLDDLVGIIQAEVDALAADGVNIIILSSHLQRLTEELSLIGNLRGIDAIVGGGGGELLANPGDLLVPGDAPQTVAGQSGYPIFGTDADGNQIPIVTTSGDYRYVGRLILGFDTDGNLVEVLDESGPVRVSGIGADAVSPDPQVQELVVDPVAAGVAALAANVIGRSEVDLDGRRSRVRNFETNLGNLIADAFLQSGIELAPVFGVATPDVALANGGGIRNDSVIPAGDITELDTFSILPFSNFITVVPAVPAEQFKEILENAVSRQGLGDGRFAQIAGFTMEFDWRQQAQVLDGSLMVVTPGERVRNVTLNDGTAIVSGGEVVPGAPAIDVAIVDFLARGGDFYPFRGLPFTNLGQSYQQSLASMIEGTLMGMITADAYPEGGEGRIVQSCLGDFDLDGELTVFDFLAFQNAFDRGLASADCNRDGRLDLFDFLCFQNAFAAGCP